jgi:mannan endo-1,4-beta-mannosidase
VMTRRPGFILILLLSVLILTSASAALAQEGAARSTRTIKPMPTSALQGDSNNQFVTVVDGSFMLGDRPYYFVGTNFWQGMNLAVDDSTGDRERLLAELDHLQALGVTNLRVMASSEGPDTEPYRAVPSLMTAPGQYNQAVLDGLDFLLDEMGKRGLRAVMVLGNYWQWSGGFAQYVSWHEGTPIPYPGDWQVFINYVAKFYECAECQGWYHDHIAAIVNRTNVYNGLAYKDDPAIFAWELANEPRRYPDAWIDDTAAYIKSLDPNHLVTTGSEGEPPGENQDFIKTHDGSAIDYGTIHIWPQNWGWYDPENPSTYENGEANARQYFQAHAAYAAQLGKPLVLEEFGMARDYQPPGDIYNPESPTTYRDRFYAAMFEEVLNSITSGGPAAGINFWAWGGRARPGIAWIGDPPHEPPGWYSVYDTDQSTLAIISSQAEAINGL